MSINKNRKFRFTSGDFVSNSIDETVETTSASVEKPITEFSITRKKPDSNNNSVDSATQRKLQMMAKQAKDNGGNSSGMDTEYLSKIPAYQHNQITIACAGDKVKELKKTMNDEILKTSEDEATTDILTETANDNIVYRNYDMSDIDRYMTNIESMTMLEAISLKNSVTKEVNRLESCHTMIKAVDDLRENFDFVEPGKEPTMMDRKNAGTNADKAVLTANYLDSYGYSESADEFAKLYDAYKPKLDELITALNKHIEECSPLAASTKYMTNDFLKIIDKRINNLTETDTNYAYLSKSLGTLRSAFANRTDITYLKNKMETFVANKNHLKNASRALLGTFSDVSSKMNKNFATKTMHSFIKTMDNIFDEDRYKVLGFLYFLNYVCSNEANSNADAWVKVMVLNISDIDKKIWDLDEMTEFTYLDSIKDNFMPLLNRMCMYFDNRKVKISSSINSQYDILLNWNEPVTEEKSEEVVEEITEPEEPIEEIERVDAEVIGVADTKVTEVIDTDYTTVE